MKRKIRKSARWTPGLKKLKAISIRQPWAWLIVNGYKDVENRIAFPFLFDFGDDYLDLFYPKIVSSFVSTLVCDRRDRKVSELFCIAVETGESEENLSAKAQCH